MSKFKNGYFIDTVLQTPSQPPAITKMAVEKDLIVNHLKMNSGITVKSNVGNLPTPVYEDVVIDLKQEDGVTNKTGQELYNYLDTWEIQETLFNAYFARNLEAGTIGADGGEIYKFIIKRLSKEDNYRMYEDIGELPYDDRGVMTYRDYLINSGAPYFYSIMPVARTGAVGGAQMKKIGVNNYDYSWLIDASGHRLQLANLELSDINFNTKDGLVETLGSRTPYVSRLSASNYQTFEISGIIASELDFEGNTRAQVELDKNKALREISEQGNNFDTPFFDSPKDDQYDEEISNDIIQAIDDYYYSKIPNENFKGNEDYYRNDKSITRKTVSNAQRDINFEREFRNKVVSILNNGDIKIFKSPTEGLLAIKLSDVKISPINELGRTLYRFSAQATEVGDLDRDMMNTFRKAVDHEER